MSVASKKLTLDSRAKINFKKLLLKEKDELALQITNTGFIKKVMASLPVSFIRNLSLFLVNISSMQPFHIRSLIKALKQLVHLKKLIIRAGKFLKKLAPALYTLLKEKPKHTPPKSLDRIQIWTLYSHRHLYSKLARTYYFCSRLALNCCRVFETQTDAVLMPYSAKYFFEAAEKKGRQTKKYTFALGKSHNIPKELFKMCERNLSVFNVQERPNREDTIPLI